MKMAGKRSTARGGGTIPKIGRNDAAEIERIRREWDEAKIEAAYATRATTLPANWDKIQDNIIRGDKDRCCVCGNKSKYAKLLVHHRDSDESNRDKSNYMTICLACHEKFPVPPFSERFYCKMISHDFPTNVICIRFGRKFGLIPDVRKCVFHDDKHGCLAIAWKLTKDDSKDDSKKAVN